RIAETIEGQFAEIAESQPELLARHCTEAGLIEKAAGLWGEAGQRSMTLQVALINPLMHGKGYAAPETKAAVERARLLIEQAEVRGEPPEDPLLLFSVLYGLWGANFLAFNGDVVRELAAQFLALAEKQGAVVPLMVGHRMMGLTKLFKGDVAGALAH